MKHIFLLVALLAVSCDAILFPKDSPSRLVKELDGVWRFMIDDSPSRSAGFVDEWYSKPLGSVSRQACIK